jgi:DNA-binding HxlR family transcriptional regulator
MKSYGQFCPVAKAAEVFCERWTPIILRDLLAGATRFSELRRGAPLASPTLLSRRLKQLEAEGIVERRVAANGRGATYHLTPAGAEFAPLIEGLAVWGQRWSRRELAAHEVDLGLLIWAMQRSANPEALGPGRGVVKLTFTDQKGKRRDWWFVNEKGEVELCLDDPGHDVGLYLRTTLADMIYIWRGDLPLARAIAEGRLEVHGSSRAQRALPRWLGRAAVAHIPPQRAA